MYSVVGCNECETLWIIDGRPETTECPRCGKRHKTKQLKRFVETENKDQAREVRSSMLAARSGENEAYSNLDSVAELEDRIHSSGISDETYLEESGIDSEEVAEAGTRATEGTTAGGSRRSIIREAIDEIDAPSRDEVLDYATERGVPEAGAEQTLEKLLRSGEILEQEGQYRRL